MEQINERILKLVPALRMILSADALKSGSFVPLDQLAEAESARLTSRLGKKVAVFGGTDEEILGQVADARDTVGEYLLIEELGLLGISDNQSKIEQELAGVRKEGREREVHVSVPGPWNRKPLYNKVIAITGGAMGYGEGIARALFGEGAQIVLMDINEESGKAVLTELNSRETPNRALFVKTDVTSLESLNRAVYETVLEFSGLDVMISNAGVLRAGSVEEMEVEKFRFVTRVNYEGYFNCVKASVPVMKVQNHYHPGNFGDIIQINSKSGLVGSLRNAAYAGSKFGGIGLTHSFAMELIGERIKVNAICPGNYFEGPLWSDPENGLFVQYLHAGKVPGAKTIADVKRHYESMVPAGRGCRVEDVTKAIKYVIDQEYETGQAIPVTGGQVMLS
jgi:sorbitol-6-phosphate 2-dehydrogenase